MFSSWKYIRKPPRFDEVAKWCKEHGSTATKSIQSQIDLQTPHNKFLYKFASDASVKEKEKTKHCMIL